MGRAQLELKLLGPPEARRDGAPLRLRTRKTLALLAYLAADGRSHRRAELAALLWPESDESRARTTLRSALADLRSALGSDDGPSLLVERDSLRFGADLGASLDLTVLRTAYERARSSARDLRLDGEEGRELGERLRAGATAYAGEFLQDFHLDDAPDFDLWSGAERERWRTRLVVVLERLSGLLLESGEAREAVAVAERWAGEEPASAAAHERLMRATYAVGDREGALAVYERYRTTADRSGGQAAAPQLEALAARIAAERRIGAPSARRTPPPTPRTARATECGHAPRRACDPRPTRRRALRVGCVERGAGCVATPVVTIADRVAQPFPDRGEERLELGPAAHEAGRPAPELDVRPARARHAGEGEAFQPGDEPAFGLGQRSSAAHPVNVDSGWSTSTM